MQRAGVLAEKEREGERVSINLQLVYIYIYIGIGIEMGIIGGSNWQTIWFRQFSLSLAGVGETLFASALAFGFLLTNHLEGICSYFFL